MPVLRRRSAHLALVGAVVAAVTAVQAGGLRHAGASEKPVAPVDASAGCRTPHGTTARVTLHLDGQGARSALVHVPRKARGRRPLLLALHGAYANGAFMERYSRLSRIADREGFTVVYPDAAGPRWRIAEDESDADVSFLDKLVDELSTGGCVDGARVSVTGVSNGGGMAARFACEADDRLAGLVTVAGGYVSLPRCAARRPLSVLEIHGTADAVVPYAGNDPRDPSDDVLTWIRGWVTRDGCRRPARSRTVSNRVVRLEWSPCRAGTAVEHLRLAGGTHAWPGADPPDTGPDLGVSASEEAWRFLRSRHR